MCKIEESKYSPKYNTRTIQTSKTIREWECKVKKIIARLRYGNEEKANRYCIKEDIRRTREKKRH